MHVCLFDIDGTLLNTGGAGQAAMEAALVLEFGVEEPVTGIPTAGRTDRAITTDLLKFYGFENAPEMGERFRSAYLRHLPDHLKTREGTVLPGISALLEALGGRDDLLLGLLTGNYREGARLKLEHYELHHHFGFGGFGDHHLDRDDVAREAWSEVQKRVNGSLDADCVWVIGDTPSDVRCARAIGVKVVAVATGLFPLEQLEAEEPDQLLSDLSDPRPLLELLQ